MIELTDAALRHTLGFPDERTTWTDRRGVEWEVSADFALDALGLHCTRISLAAADPNQPAARVTKRLLSELPLAALTQDFAAHMGATLRRTAAAWDPPDGVLGAVAGELDQEVEQERPGPRAGSVAFYREVARVYREALATGGRPTKAVAEHWTVSSGTAATWVRRARKAGVLGASPGQGVAGGQPRREEEQR